LNKKTIKVVNWHRIADEYKLPVEVQAKIRYRQDPKPATLIQNIELRTQNIELRTQNIKNEEMKIEFKEKQWAIAP